jgi:hypothetical protein
VCTGYGSLKPRCRAHIPSQSILSVHTRGARDHDSAQTRTDSCQLEWYTRAHENDERPGGRSAHHRVGHRVDVLRRKKIMKQGRVSVWRSRPANGRGSARAQTVRKGEGEKVGRGREQRTSYQIRPRPHHPCHR